VADQVSITGTRFATPFVTPEDEARYLGAGYWTADVTLAKLLQRNARNWPDRIAVVDAAGRQLSYAQLSERATRLAAALRGRGFVPGDVAGIQLPNRVEAVLCALAVQLAGGIVCPLVTPYRRRELSFIVGRTGMKALVVPGTYRGFDHDELARSLRADHPELTIPVTLTDEPTPGLVRLADLLAEQAPPLDPYDADARDVAAILFTSGTEADPKGILHTHNTLLANLRALQSMLGLGDGDGVFMASPLGHGTGYGFGTYLAIYLGSTLALLDVWDAARAAELMSRHHSVYTHGATPFVQDLLNSPAAAQADLSDLRYFVTGGATVPPGTAGRVRDVLGCQLLRLYGQTEGFMATLSRVDDPLSTVESTDGRPVAGVEVRVLDEDGNDVPPGIVGECVYKGPHRCVGYLDDDVRAAASVTRDNWFRSGDLVRFVDGSLSVSGRKKEVINRGGYKYSPREVEDVLANHPDIERVAVVRMDDPRLVDRACAFVVARGGAQPTVRSIGEYLRTSGIASFKWPERVEVVGELPMTASGKVQKFVLEARLRTTVGDQA
jgi:non-ribosomal peptide synthetase component E (peptide arylation enzyme)